MHSLLFLSLVLSSGSVSGFDYIAKALSYVDNSVDPCDNFYRHACPIGSPDFVLSAITEDAIKSAVANKSGSVLEKLDIFTDGQKVRSRPNFAELIPSIYKDLCDAGGKTALFLEQVEKLLLFDSECFGEWCLAHLSGDSNCERVTAQLKLVLSELDSYLEGAKKPQFRGRLKKIFRNLELHARNVMAMELYLRGNIQNGIADFHSFLKEMKEIIIDMIKVTPWALNQNVTELIESVAANIHLAENPEKDLKETMEVLSHLNGVYTKCKENFAEADKNETIIFCYLHTSEFITKETTDNPFYTFGEAFTIYPRISFGFAWYLMMQNSNNLAFKIGAPGFPLAHELSHALIKSTSKDILTYFSKNASTCIETQYNSFCKEYKETSCEIRDDMADDNGADVLGLEIALTLLHRKLDDKQLGEFYSNTGPRLSQLFFYSGALSLCSGNPTKSDRRDNHAPLNVRVNTMANHPDFQKAFQCDENSRMMRTTTKHCSIYGEDAPATRRRLAPEWDTKN